ncbi:MAG: hypothetical protein WD749_00540 [Phycisphaerales bacterium]
MAKRAPVRVVEALNHIVETNERLRSFWASSHGWAPRTAADMLAKSRLDRHVALSLTLKLWVRFDTGPDEEGRLILAWTNLGALLEGSFKTLLAVYLEDYRRSARPIRRHGKVIDPDEATLDGLLTFLRAEVWSPTSAANWGPWAQRVQQRRNAVHAFRERDLGTFAEFYGDVVTYDEFLQNMELGLPYPS